MIAMEGQFRSWGRFLIDSSDVCVLFACGRGAVGMVGASSIRPNQRDRAATSEREAFGLLLASSDDIGERRALRRADGTS